MAVLQFEGDRVFAQAPAVIWGKLADARFLAGCIPDVKSVASAEPAKAVLTLQPGFSFVRGTLDVTLTVAEAVENQSVRVLAQSKGIGSRSDVEAALSLSPHEGGTRIHWVAEVKELGGLLKAVPRGLVQAAAQKVIGDVWQSVAAKLAS